MATHQRCCERPGIRRSIHLHASLSERATRRSRHDAPFNALAGGTAATIRYLVKGAAPPVGGSSLPTVSKPTTSPDQAPTCTRRSRHVAPGLLEDPLDDLRGRRPGQQGSCPEAKAPRAASTILGTMLARALTFLEDLRVALLVEHVGGTESRPRGGHKATCIAMSWATDLLAGIGDDEDAPTCGAGRSVWCR